MPVVNESDEQIIKSVANQQKAQVQEVEPVEEGALVDDATWQRPSEALNTL